MGQKRWEKAPGSCLPPYPDGSSGAFWVKFHKTLRCNSVSQTEPPTVDTPLTSTTLPRDTSPAHSFPSGRGEPGSLWQIFSEKTSKTGQPGLPRYFLGGEPTLNPGTNFTQGCLRKTFLPRSTHWHRNRFNRKSQKAAWLCFPLLSIPTHIKPGLHLKPDLWELPPPPLITYKWEMLGWLHSACPKQRASWRPARRNPT